MTVRSNDKKKIKVLDKKRLVDSFRYASYGIVEAYKGEQNLRIHTVVAVLVIICGFVFQISYVEWLICFVLIGLVLMSEFFNTAIEYVVDLASPDIHPLAKLAKDICIGRSNFSYWKNGKLPKFETLIMFAKYLECYIDDFMDFE